MTSDIPAAPADHAPPLGFEKHDHRACVDQALAAADARCAAEGLRLTPVRRKTLELLLQEHRALGAYAVLDLLHEAGFRIASRRWPTGRSISSWSMASFTRSSG